MMIRDREKYMAIVDGDIISPSDAIVLLEGDGLNRCNHAAYLYSMGYAPLVVFSGSAVDYKYGSFPFQEAKPILVKLGIPASVLVYEDQSKQTRQQADEIMKMSANNGWKKIILVASNYHQYRAYLTFIKSMLSYGLKIQIYNSPSQQLPWFENNAWGKRIDLLEIEFSKIEQYQVSGDVASFEEAISYQQWKELHRL